MAGYRRIRWLTVQPKANRVAENPPRSGFVQKMLCAHRDYADLLARAQRCGASWGIECSVAARSRCT